MHEFKPSQQIVCDIAVNGKIFDEGVLVTYLVTDPIPELFQCGYWEGEYRSPGHKMLRSIGDMLSLMVDGRQVAEALVIKTKLEMKAMGKESCRVIIKGNANPPTKDLAPLELSRQP